MNRIDRLFGITTLLQAKKYVTAEQLAEHFGISVRTVYRDVRALGEQGIPISFEQNRGYYLVQGYFLPPVSFTAGEANALLLLETIGTILADASIQAQCATALQKVQAVLRNAEKEGLAQLSSRVKMHLPEYDGGAGHHLATVQAAIAGGRILELDYCNKSGGTSQRRVEPIGLVFYNFAWHIIGWCHLRREYRDFKALRIRQLTATTLPFERQQHLSLGHYIASLNLPYDV
jgi:predicted DNA-binding transcriptional regulator YafY